MQMIKAVLFDFDGTLLDRDKSVMKFVDKQYDRLNNWLGHIPKMTYIKRFIELDSRGYVWKDKVYQQLVHEFKINEVTWEHLLQDYIDEFKHYCVPFPNLLNMLEELRRNDIVLGMITNGYGQFQMDNIKALGIEDYFETILISEWEGIKKPDIQIFKRALNQLNVVANHSLFVGDHLVNDVKASQIAGMKSIWKKDVQWDSVGAEFIINDLAEIPIIIKNLNPSPGKITLERVTE